MEENKDFNKIIITDTLSEVAIHFRGGYLAQCISYDYFIEIFGFFHAQS